MTKLLRNGYTTGSSVVAAAVATLTKSAESVDIILPSNERLNIPVARLIPNGAVVVKDGGDDPDVTTNCEIIVRLNEFTGELLESDYVVDELGLYLVIRGGAGVGLVTRSGLACLVEKKAINPVPRKMLHNNLIAHNLQGRYIVEIEVPRGEEVAKLTLNPTLGIINGISIIGTSGIVRPYSNSAYAATIVLQLKTLFLAGKSQVVFSTGNRTSSGILRDYPNFSDEEVIRIGDFVYSSISGAKKLGYKKAIVACMPGKLFKYACGEKNTHAHNVKLTLKKLEDFGIKLNNIDLEKLDSMGELATFLSEKEYSEVLDVVYLQALKTLQDWAGDNMEISIALYDVTTKRIK